MPRAADTHLADLIDAVLLPRRHVGGGMVALNAQVSPTPSYAPRGHRRERDHR